MLEQRYSGNALELFKITRQHVSYWRKIGLLPKRKKGEKPGYTFQEMMAINVIVSLTKFGIRPSRVKDTLLELQKKLPNQKNHLTSKRLYVRGKEIFIIHGGKIFEPRTGQLLLCDVSKQERKLRNELKSYEKKAA